MSEQSAQERAFSSLKWSALSEVVSRSIQPLTFVVLSHLLGPDQFGVVAAALVVVNFAQVFWEAGLSKVLIQQPARVDDAATIVLYSNVALAIVVGAALYAAAPRLSIHLFDDPRVADVLRLMVIYVVVNALSSVHVALLQKSFRFRQLFWVRMVAAAVPAAVAIPLAMIGWEHRALVYGAICGACANLVLVRAVSKWRSSGRFDPALAKRLAVPSLWITLSGLFGWFYLWADSLIVGWGLGTHELGLFVNGNMLTISAYGLLLTPVLPVLYSYLAQMQSDIGRVRDTLEQVIRLIVVSCVPLACVVFIAAPPLAELIFSERWHGIGPVIAVMAMVHGIAWSVGMNGEAHRAIGKPWYETYAMGASLAVYLAVYVVAVRYGLETFLWARFALALVGVATQMYFAHLAFGLRPAGPAGFLFKVALSSMPILGIGAAVSSFELDLVAHTAAALVAGCAWALGVMAWYSNEAPLWLMIKKTLGVTRND